MGSSGIADTAGDDADSVAVYDNLFGKKRVA